MLIRWSGGGARILWCNCCCYSIVAIFNESLQKRWIMHTATKWIYVGDANIVVEVGSMSNTVLHCMATSRSHTSIARFDYVCRWRVVKLKVVVTFAFTDVGMRSEFANWTNSNIAFVYKNYLIITQNRQATYTVRQTTTTTTTHLTANAAPPSGSEKMRTSRQQCTRATWTHKTRQPHALWKRSSKVIDDRGVADRWGWID